MNGNLAYWQLDFTVESQANLPEDCMVMQEKSKSFRPTLLLGLWLHAAYCPPLFSDIFFKAWSHACIMFIIQLI